MIEFECPVCNKICKVPDSVAGKRGKCPKCHAVIEVPDPNAGAGGGGGGKGPARDEDEGAIAPGDERACPYCGEKIRKVAKKCRHCGEFLDAALRRAQRDGGRHRELETSGKAIAGLICAFLCPLIGLILCALAQSDISAGKAKGQGLVTAGFVISVIFIILNVAISMASR